MVLVLVVGPDSGCDSSCFTCATLQRSLRGPEASSVVFILSFTASSCRTIVCCGSFRTLDGREHSSYFTYKWDPHVMSTGSIGVKALTCRHLQCSSCCRLVNLLHQITVNLPVICCVGQFDLVWEMRQVTEERFRHNAHTF